MLSHRWSVESSVILCEYTCAFFRKLKCGLSSIVSNSFHLLRNLSGERLLQPYTSVDNQGLLVRYFKYDHNYGRSRDVFHPLVLIKTLFTVLHPFWSESVLSVFIYFHSKSRQTVASYAGRTLGMRLGEPVSEE